MKKITFYIAILAGVLAFSQQQNVAYEISPCTFQEDEEITIIIDGTTIDESAWNVTNNELYLWSWSFDLTFANLQDSPFNGTWTSSNAASIFTYDSVNDEYRKTIIPDSYFQRNDIGRLGFLIKAQDGSGDKKSQDILADVGASSFNVNLSAPTENTVLLTSGDNLTITATNSCGTAQYVLSANGSVISTQNGESFTYTDNNITQNQAYTLEVTLGPDVRSIPITAILNPNAGSQAMPSGLKEGINYDTSDPTKATLVIDAPNKDYIYVAGSFNDDSYQPKFSDAMLRDSNANSDKFFIELTGLTPGEVYTYQYWVVDETPISGSPSLVKTADPYSTLVLSPFDDPFIPAATYPNLPTYPDGQEREVTVLQTNQTEYNWVVDNFDKPKKEDLIIYEVLVRDFESNRNYQDLIDRIDYFKELNINAIQLMPVMEFEGNESWGYNTSFHMALDKFYGTENKFKEFIDLCHQNGIAVILDIALNHAFGRNPLVRMWMNDPDGNGWGDPSTENPYFNVNAQHSFNVGYDFSHTEELPNTPGASSNDDTNPITNHYVERVIEHWITEFKIDGFRWDLTKGFTQNCTGGDDFCTNAYQQDRVDILQDYADYSWSLDPTHYVIFEHLGTDGEEQQWANYRLTGEADGIPKGIMMWGKMTAEFNELTMGQDGNKNINRAGHLSRGFSEPRLIGYPESHDEERLMYNNLQFGKNLNGYDITDLDTALGRMSALGAVSVMLPGPKMIWHFGGLGMEQSIFTCTNGTVNTENDATAGDCKLDTKPQPQWPWYDTANPTGTIALRQQIFNDWARLHELKINEAVFEGDYTITSDAGSFTPRIDIFDSSIPLTELRNVIILSNFDVVNQDISFSFPSGVTDTWYDLMDPTGATTFPDERRGTINLAPGEFKVLGNKNAQALSTTDFDLDKFRIFPNPATTEFMINVRVSDINIVDITGKTVKTFNGSFNRNSSFNIEDLNPGIYIVKTISENNQINTTKLIKL
ncbi:MAG: T9SS C-terminal target domain-containing protein [Winogradskyella sp.]|uniref:alpha-amylase family glycosyl hydrolase n=1 Tax=Winogradskyella sp. TaxID=1883156 RepID=UPI000F40134C|nr:alpha-amylase family glycosyl hydrolase [Winogradskyella sp.]RNC87702.1 MAG: T9SS C-terminal target domain-containing protein [Winogradskyella sp.]